MKITGTTAWNTITYVCILTGKSKTFSYIVTTHHGNYTKNKNNKEWPKKNILGKHFNRLTMFSFRLREQLKITSYNVKPMQMEFRMHRHSLSRENDPKLKINNGCCAVVFDVN